VATKKTASKAPSKKAVAADVPAYIEQAPVDRQEALRTLRTLCRKHLKGADERIEYGMPSYYYDGAICVAFASQKQYISLYVLKEDVVNEYREALGCDIGKGCIRFRHPDRIDFETVGKLLVATAKSKSLPC
jgi:uncharacterized protein YdhG (YjbR/CyaY superfamily)